jgi:iron-sulfur cluster repair protein YtfE (RIC family)
MGKRATFSSSLLKEHADIGHLFDNHQRALLLRDIDVALASLATFSETLERHIAYEEKTVLPLYAAKGGETEGGTLKIFQAEHRKLLDTAAKLTKHTGALYGSRDMLGSILALLDEEAGFKGLLNHHSLREKNLLFPRLDARTTATERRKVLN